MSPCNCSSDYSLPMRIAYSVAFSSFLPVLASHFALLVEKTSSVMRVNAGLEECMLCYPFMFDMMV